ncbi:MAG TPA: glycerate kinase [Chthoniobacterales bacterium]
MKILVAPDKFKGCLSAHDVAKEISAGVHAALPRAEIGLLPIADGGEGTAEVIRQALGGTTVNCPAHDALGRIIQCRYTMIEDRKLAVMEMSEAAGMRRLKESEQNPMHATTFGVGQLVLDAARKGAETIIVGLGGSATNDGGFGLARALGYRFFDGEGIQVRIAISKLRTLKIIDVPKNLSLPPIIGAVDVQTPLLGRHGATRVFGPQKGVTNAELPILEKCLKRLAKVASRQVRPFNLRTPGAGAAGGLGFGLIVFARATLQPGFDLVAEMIGLESKIRNADIIITGEGRLDGQTLKGKGPAGVATMAREHGKRVFAVVGEARDQEKVGDLFEGIYQLAQPGSDRAENIARARELLRKRSADMAKAWKPR